MSTYARIVSGYAVDVVVTPPLLNERFNAEWLAHQTFIVVPDGTQNGAKDNGDGSYTNPAVISSNSHAVKVAIGLTDFEASIRARAAQLFKQGKYAEGTALLATIGG